jgi:hypothetical protein
LREGALNTETGILDRVNQGRTWGASNISDAERGLVDATQRGEMFGIGGLADSDRFDSEMGYRNKALNLGAIEGLRGLRTDTPGEVNMYENNILQGMNQGDQARNAIIGQNAAYHPNQNWFQRNKEALGFGLSAASMLIPGGGGGVSNLFKKKLGAGPAGAMPTPYGYG